MTVRTTTERFAAMGSEAEVTVVDGPPSLRLVARARLRDLESRWSRFLPTSEVSRLNAARGLTVRVSAETCTLLSLANEGHELTAGRFDPWQLGAIEAAGYRTTLAELETPAPEPVPARARVSNPVAVDHEARTACLLDGARFDPGGIGKGLAADFVAEELLALGAAGVCVNVGGDLRVGGRAPHGDGWLVALRDVSEDLPAALVVVAEGAVATTSRSRRRWRTNDGVEHHHILDPATGASAVTSSIRATAIASRAWQAEILSKVAFLDGALGIECAESMGATAMVVTDHAVFEGPGFAKYVHVVTEVA